MGAQKPESLGGWCSGEDFLRMLPLRAISKKNCEEIGRRLYGIGTDRVTALAECKRELCPVASLAV
jgi:hypothetical protein